ncbi:hypothetical protein HK100_010660 [Physocladia obscura]|uniref:Calcipressin n=1 Tax=Physocladia obscura TaxID=109957 RepID=A0AAD5T328_9FUNG|nr:hypothetical protein HK100_010660 [Physocladia obscura]
MDLAQNESSNRTNSLLFTNLHHSVFDDSGKAQLRNLIEQHGHIVRFIPITAFFRFFVVFHNVNEATHVKQHLNGTIFLGSKELKVYYGENTDINSIGSTPNAASFLQVPALERNFLLSPPGSPPVGWVQTTEAQPSPGGHHEAMLYALARLHEENNDFILDSHTKSMDSIDSMQESRDSFTSTNTSKTSDSGGSGNDLTMEIAKSHGYHAGRRTKHVLTFDAPLQARQKEEDMEWQTALPLVVVEDHDIHEEENSDEESRSNREGSSLSLAASISCFNMNVSHDSDSDSDSDSDDRRNNAFRSSSRDGQRTPIPRTQLPNAMAIPRTSMPPMFQQ